MTVGVFEGWGQIIGRLVNHQGLPAGAQLVGPVGIMGMMAKEAQMGASYYLQFVAMISVYLAVFNALPIPALDGGRFMFLALEAIRRKPISLKVEQTLTTVFFAVIMLFAIIVTIQDVRNLPAVVKLLKVFIWYIKKRLFSLKTQFIDFFLKYFILLLILTQLFHHFSLRK